MLFKVVTAQFAVIPCSVFLLQKKQVSTKGGAAAMYGMVAKIPDKTLIDDFVVEFFSEVYKV